MGKKRFWPIPTSFLVPMDAIGIGIYHRLCRQGSASCSRGPTGCRPGSKGPAVCFWSDRCAARNFTGTLAARECCSTDFPPTVFKDLCLYKHKMSNVLYIYILIYIYYIYINSWGYNLQQIHRSTRSTRSTNDVHNPPKRIKKRHLPSPDSCNLLWNPVRVELGVKGTRSRQG